MTKFTVEKPGSHHFNKIIRVNIISNVINQCTNLIGCNERNTALLPSYCCQRYITCTESKWIVKKTQIRAHLKNIWLVIFKRIKIINVKKAERLISDWKRLEAQQLSTTHESWLYTFVIKDTLGIMDKTWMESED